MEIVEKLLFFGLLFLGVIAVYAIYAFAKVILKNILLILKLKVYSYKYQKKFEYLADKKRIYKLTEEEDNELRILANKLNKIVSAIPFQKHS